MTPERLQEIRDKLTRGAPVNTVTVGLDLLNYIDLLHEDLRITRAERDAEKHKNLALRKGQGTYHQENK